MWTGPRLCAYGCIHKTILAVCAVVLSRHASSQEMPKFERPECLPLSSVLGALLGGYHETPLFAYQVGKEDQTMLVVSQQTGTVTQLAACSTKDGHEGARVILAGKNFKAFGVDDLKRLLGPQL